SVFNVGQAQVLIDGIHSIPNGRGGRIASGSNAPLYVSDFFSKGDAQADQDMFRDRLATALDLDLAGRVLASSISSLSSASSPSSVRSPASTTTTGRKPPQQSAKWENGAWVYDLPGGVLNAPGLRDDYYCSLLAYSPTVHCLAVGLGSNVYFWSEGQGITPENVTSPFSSHITSLSFSSEDGGKAMLAIGRADGRVTLRELCFDADHPSPVSCVAFAPRQTERQSFRDAMNKTQMELLAVGDEVGQVYLYAVEWPHEDQRNLHNWHGAMNILVRLDAHSQQVCGFAWSTDNSFLASGGNDNCAYIFETRPLLSTHKKPRQHLRPRNHHPGTLTLTFPQLPSPLPNPTDPSLSFPILPGSAAKHRIPLSAAIKALAFAPFAPSLLALGAGSNDRGIHFHHASSGAKLAAIDCAAQVTSLTWSSTRAEIAATFGFAQPEHRTRVAVYAWPGCQLLVRLEWPSDDRALWGVAWPGGPEGSGRRAREGAAAWKSRTGREGGLVVAASDASIKFHEVWSDEPGGRRIAGGNGGVGMLGGGVLEGEMLGERL
ncbi:WD40 repeat-like protein, partial [Myriangium duriaei CBS 260.36]